MLKRLPLSPLFYTLIFLLLNFPTAHASVSGTVKLTDARYEDIGFFYPPQTPRVYVEVVDPDRNLDIDNCDTLGVIFTTEQEGDLEYVILNEQGTNSGIFRGYIPVNVIPFILPRPSNEAITTRMLELSYNPNYIEPNPEIPGSEDWPRQRAEFSLMRELIENEGEIEPSVETRLDELGVLELTSGSSIVCRYTDPINDWGYEEVILDAAIYGGYAGDVSGQTWTADNNPYVIVGEVYTHDPDNPLVVRPGVHIQFTGDFWFQSSSIELNGEEGDSIYFEAHPDFDPQGWVYNIGFNNVVEYVVFQGPCRGGIGYANHCRFSNHYLLETSRSYDSCIFSDNQPRGLPQFNSSDISITNCEFTANQGSGCALGASNIQISNSVFQFNQGHGLFLNAPPSTITITDSRFTENWYTGLYIHSLGLDTEISINNCQIHDNYSGFDFYNTSFIDINACSNDWGEATTAEMNAGENPKNISTIYDEFDESGRGRVDYSGYIGNDNPGIAAELKFTNANYQPVENYPLTISNVYIILTDDDANSNPNLPDTVGIILSSDHELDFEYLILTETDINSNVFHGSIPVSRLALRMNEPDPGDVDRLIMSIREEFPDRDDESLKEIAVKRVRERMYRNNELWNTSNSSLDEVGVLEVYGGDVITALYPAADGDSVYNEIFFGGISGAISNMVLTSANSPYVVSGDIFAENIVIQPGVEILFYDDFSFTTTGTFTCQGIESDSIVFRSHPEYLGSTNEPWIFEPSLESNPLEYIVFENYGLVIVSYQRSFSHTRFTNVDTYNRGTISNSMINNCPYANAVNMNHGTVLNSIIEFCDGNGISSDRSFEIHDVTIRNNGGYGIKLTGGNTSGGIDGCTIINNQAGGIYARITYGYPIVQFNDIYDNGFAYDFINESELDIDARYNYWGPETTVEMDAFSSLVNISRIYDHFDNSDVSTVDYLGFTGSEFSGIKGSVKLTDSNWNDIGARYTLDATSAYAEVIDPDRNIDNTQPDTLGVTFSTESEVENEYIIMTETGNNTGIFHGSIPLNPLTAISVVDELGVLEVSDSEMITCTYADPQSYWNEVEDITDHAIYGGIEGNVSNQVWTAENNPYVIVGDCYNVHDQPLIVEAGVEILFAAAVSFEGIMNEFNGSETDSIRVGIHPAFYKDWSTLYAPTWRDRYDNIYTYTVFDSLYQMYLSNSNYSSCRVSHVYQPMVEGYRANVDSSLFSENEQGVSLYVCNSFTNTHVINNKQRGLVLDGCYHFKNNLIEGNAEYGLMQNDLASSQTSLITDCIIRNNSGYGITNHYPLHGQLIVHNCDLYGNTSGMDFYLNNSPGPVDARYNYWGDERTMLLYQGDHPRSIENIHDYFDDQNLGMVNYSNWLNHSITEAPYFYMPPPGHGDFNVLINNAFIDELPLEGGDEIGVFDTYEGEIICVGAVTVPLDFAWEDYLRLPAIRKENDGDLHLPGYTNGHDISYRFYDSSEETEVTAFGTYDPGFEDMYGYGSGTIVTLSTEPTNSYEDNLNPTSFEVYTPFPNPTNSCFTIAFDLPEKGNLVYTIFNVLGQVVQKENSIYMAGHHNINVRYKRELVSGVYFIKVEYLSDTRIKKLLYLK